MILRLLLLSLLFISPVLAYDPKCSFGSTPLSASVTSFPGGEVVVPWSMYNYYGDRPTFVNISVDGGGLLVDVLNQVILQPNSSTSKAFVTHPINGDKIPAEDVFVKIRVPSDYTNSSSRVVLTANAFCELESGQVMPGVQMVLEVAVDVLDAETYNLTRPSKDYSIFFYAAIILAVILLLVLLVRKINNRRFSRTN